MKNHSKSTLNLLTLFALLISMLVSAAAVSPVHAALPANLPAELTAADWKQIEALLPPAPQAYIKASNTGANDYFSGSIALSGDTLVVGARGEASNATGINGDQTNNSRPFSGAVYVFTRSGTTWSQQAYLKASNAQAADWFGSSVAISGDTIVVGAIFESSNATGVNGNQADNSAIHSGAAYVFTRSGTSWSQQAYLKASNTEANDWFGCSVAVSGDTIVVGAKGEDSTSTMVIDNAAANSGAAYVFSRSGTTWSPQAHLKASNAGANDQFGYSVSISGDALVVGAFGESSNATDVNGNESDNSATSSGAAYVFSRSGTTWSQQAYLKASNTEANEQFGYSASISGDTIVVGALYESSSATSVNGNEADNSAINSGAAYVFARSAGTWSQQAYLKAANANAGDFFGWSVAISGDTIIVGSYAEASSATGVNGNGADNSTAYSGAAYAFTRSGTTWSQLAYLKASNPGSNDFFGSSVAVSGDTLAAGAYAEASNAIGVDGNGADNSTTNAGAAYVFFMDTAPSVISITRASANPTSASSVDFTISFSEPVTGVDVSDFSPIASGGVSSSAVTGISGSGSIYTVTVSTGSGSGSLHLDLLNDGSIKDDLQNPLAAGFTSGESYTVNKSSVFVDVPLTYWANGFIERLYNAHITGGCITIPLSYCPDSSVTRAQMAVFLEKGLHGSGFNPPTATGTKFTDVPTSYWAAAWIEALAADGITGGCGNNNYCPDAEVTRAQMAVFLLKAMHGSSYTPPTASGTKFTDVSSSYWAAAWVEQLAAEGITSGCGTGTYCPDSSVTRAQMAVFLVKAFNLP